MLRSPDTAAFRGFENAVGDGWIDSNSHQLLNVSRGGRAARAEYMSLNVDLRSRKVAQISGPTDAHALTGLARRHGASAAVLKG